MTALIFGINGQDGHYLSKLLIENNVKVIGISRSNKNWIIGDIKDYNFVTKIIKESLPDYIFHLAANSTTSHEALFENHDSITTGTLNILEASYKLSPNSKIFLSGSGLQFQNNGEPIKENDPFEANSPYSLSRISSVYAGRYYRGLGLKIYIGYFFNHDSPLRSERHVNQKIVQSLKRIANGSQEILNLFDISVKKEFGYAGDIVKAIWLFIQNESIFETVIGTGIDYNIEDWLCICGFQLNIKWENHVVVNGDFKKEYNRLVSKPDTIFSLGWSPQVSINNLATLMINETSAD